MERLYMSMENLHFTLKEVHDIASLLNYPRFDAYDMDGIDIILQSAKDLSDKEYFPFIKEMDEKPAVYKDGEVICHPQVGKIMKVCGENGWIGATFDYDKGGSQMPHLLNCAALHIMESANNHLTGYPALTGGAAHLIISFGSDELYEKFVPKMLSGEWGGTMALTEPQAGSSLSDIKTQAKPTDNDYYKIEGQKIFISGGDHQYCENFVHLTLARIDGAPAGTKGISLFAVPKFRDQNGALVSNGLETAGEFEKLGQRGYVTTHLVYGENEECRGWLVGEPNKGLSYMFQMMNGARIDVGLTATSTATAAYYASLQYAKERPQGRKMTRDGTKNVHEEQTLIINHADVRRMLLLQKAICEGSLSLLLFCAKLSDLVHVETGEIKETNHLLLELLVPIAKTYPSDEGLTSISNGLQVLGGYGYTMDFILQQYYRDIRIMSLYEGTSGIQSIDLLGRKMTMENGKAAKILLHEVSACVKKAAQYPEFQRVADQMNSCIVDLNETVQFLMPFAMKGDYERFLADASIFMELMSRIVIGWQWMEMGIKAKEMLIMGSSRYTEDFLESKIHTMKFYFNYEIPKVRAAKETICSSEILTIVSEKEMIK